MMRHKLSFFLFSLLISASGLLFSKIPAGTLIQNIAIANYQTPEGLKLTAYSNSVSVKVKQVYGVDIKADTDKLAVLSGDTVNIPLTLTNTGNGPDTFEVIAENLKNDSGDLENIQIYWDKNNNGVLDIGEPLYEKNTPTLQMDESIHLIAVGKVPSLKEGSSIKVEFVAKSGKNPNTVDTTQVELIVESDYVIGASLNANKEAVNPGENVTLTLNFQNRGNSRIPGKDIPFDENNDGLPEYKKGILGYIEIPPQFSLENIAKLIPDRGIPIYKGEKDSFWKTDPNKINGNLSYVGFFIPDNGTGVLEPNQQGLFSIVLKASEKAPAIKYPFKGRVEYGPTNNPHYTETNIVNVKVNPTIDIEVNKLEPLKAAAPSTLFLNHTIQLIGNTKGFIELEINKKAYADFLSKGGSISFLYPDGSVIVDTDGNGLPDLGYVNPGEKKQIQIKVLIPENYTGDIKIPVTFKVKGTDIQKNVTDEIFVEEVVTSQVKVSVSASVETGLKTKPLPNKKVYLYQYTPDKKLVKKYTLFTDTSGNIRFDENGNLINLYNLLQYDYLYRLTPAEPIENFPYTLSSYFKKEFFEDVKPGEKKCWDANNRPVSCSSDRVAVEIAKDKEGNTQIILKLDPAGFVYDASTGEKVNGACVYFYKCEDQSCNKYHLVTENKLDFYNDGINHQENPQVSGPYTRNGTAAKIGNGTFMFTFANFTQDDVGWYFLEVRFDCSYPAANQDLQAKYKPILLQKDKVWDPYTNPPYRGEKFYIDENFIYTPGATNIRIPLLPKDFKPLIVKKSVSASYATIGDFVKWTITVNNPNDNYIIYSVNLIDVLPKPFRYKENTTKVDDNSYSEPEISKDGITLRWYLGNLKPHETKTITFYTIVGANARNGKYKNTAYAYGWSDENKSLLIPSNTAYAYIKLSRGIFGEKCYILGDIFVDTNNNLKRDNGEEGLKNVRIYLEDGRYTLTDKEGKFHFDNVNPGTHVVVIDKNSLPPGAIVNLSDLQSLNSNSSLLVDLYPGDIYRISIPVKLTQHATQQAIVLNRTIADVRLEANSKEFYLLNLLKLKNKSKELIYNVIIKECNTSNPLEGTVSLNEAPFENPTMENGCFYWKIPVILPNEEVNLTWYSLIDKYKAGIPKVIVTYENEYGLKQEQKIELPSWIYKKDGQYILKVNKKVYNGERKDAETLNGLSKLLNQIPIKNLKVESINAEKAQQVQKPINKY